MGQTFITKYWYKTSVPPEIGSGRFRLTALRWYGKPPKKKDCVDILLAQSLKRKDNGKRWVKDLVWTTGDLRIFGKKNWYERLQAIFPHRWRVLQWTSGNCDTLLNEKEYSYGKKYFCKWKTGNCTHLFDNWKEFHSPTIQWRYGKIYSQHDSTVDPMNALLVWVDWKLIESVA